MNTDGNAEEPENLSDSYTRSSEETPDNTPKQVRSIISKKKDWRIRSFLKRQTSGALSDSESYNEWQRKTTSGTTSDSEW